jgi:4-amino-4-deoxy-L-arabinose transferase-like glycosyltransferase
VHRPALLLLFLSFVTFFVGLGRPAITDSDEAFYAEAAREMVQGGDWLTPHYNYVYRWQKPILYYWLTAVTYTIFGASEYAARLWSALSGVALAFMTWKVGRQLTARDDTGWLAGAVAATCFGYVVIARLALPDLPRVV